MSHRGRLSKTPLAPGAECAECRHVRQLIEAKHGKPQPKQPAHVVAFLDPADYEGLNMGPDAPGLSSLCWECVGNLLPWVDLPA